MGRRFGGMSSEDSRNAVASADPALPQASSAETADKELRKTVRKKAMDLLMRREHSVAELHKKLGDRDYAADIVAAVVGQLADEGLVNDARFTEAFVRYRCNHGYGPRRIQSELRERGVSEKIQSTYLDIGDPQWFEQAAQVKSKRFGADLPDDFKERARQARFLQYRGFTSDQIREVLDDS
ncbi:MAG: regulatory protein RecX [Gammaproteobacteria bacterium]|nr:regulatory protein RecX [Gammaproteobacteria bacterium]